MHSEFKLTKNENDTYCIAPDGGMLCRWAPNRSIRGQS
jgi:hypothetical protein